MAFRVYKYLVDKNSARSESKIILYRSIGIFLLFALTVYIVYYAPEGVDKLFCASLFVIFWYSKSNYFWFAFFLIISSYPAGFFTEISGINIRRLPVYSPIPSISLSMMDLFLIVALFKAILRGKKIYLIDIFNIKKIALILPFIVLVSFFYGITLKLFLNETVRGLFFYTLFFSFPALLPNKKEVYKFMVMFFPFVLLELIAQLYTVNTGIEFGNIFRAGALESIRDPLTGEIRAIPIGYIIMRLAFVFAFVLMETKEKIVPKFYALLVIIISLISVIIAETRSAITMFTFIFVLYFIMIAKKKPNIILQLFIVSIIFLIILDFANIFNLNRIVGSSYDRYVGAVSMQENSIKMEDTFDNRVSNRLPILLDAIKKSFFVGYGFSDKYFEVWDPHLGGVIVGLLQAGIFGYFFYVVFIVNLFRKSFKYIKKLRDDNSFKSHIKVFVLCFFGYLLVNLTVDPIFVLNTSMLPQDIFIQLIIATFFINLGIREHVLKKMELRELVGKRNEVAGSTV